MRKALSKLLCRDCGPQTVFEDFPGARCPTHRTYLIAHNQNSLEQFDPNLGRLISDTYLIFDKIGRGGMGSVYKAVHLTLSRIVALKLINTTGIDKDERVLLEGRFEFEAKSLSRVMHRNVLSVFDFGVSDGDCFMVLEYIQGRAVSEILKEQGRLELSLTIEIVNQLLDALDEVHARGIVHRDIKPSNLMLDETETPPRLVLIDFGVAKGRNSDTGNYQRELTCTGMAVGTPRYMAPEVLQGENLGAFSDIYAVGVMLYQLISGKAPFLGSAADVITAHLRDPVPPLPSELNMDPLDQVISTAMAKLPAKRYASAKVFKDALAQFVQGSIGTNPRLETQIIPSAIGGHGDETKTNPIELSSIDKEPDPIVPETKSRETRRAFSNAVTEPHRLTTPFHVNDVTPKDKSSSQLAFALMLGLAIVSVGVVTSMFLDGADTGSKNRMGIERATVESVSSKLDAGVSAKPESLAVVINDQGIVQAGEVVPEQTNVASNKADAGLSSKTSVTEKKVKSTSTTAPVKSRPKRRKFLKRKKPKSQPPKVAEPQFVPIESAQTEAPRPNQDTRSELIDVFKKQIDSCACDESKLTIARVQALSKASADILRVKWAEACGVMGEGCRR